MKGLISGIKRMEIHDGEGLRTTVFFKGCPLRCIWCHNPESLSYEAQTAFFREKCIGCGGCGGERTARAAAGCPVGALVSYGKEYEVEELADVLCADAPFFGKTGGVTLSGGECLSQPAFAIALARSLWERGISVYVDTCGFVSRETLEKILPYVDAFLYDLKAIDEDVHLRCTGKSNQRILENLDCLLAHGAKVEIRYPLVMGYNDGECARIGDYLRGRAGITKIKVLQYHAFAGSRYEALGMETTLPRTETTPRDIEHAVQLLQGYGLHAVNGMRED